MLFGALVVGLLTAYYYGLNVGIAAALGAAGLFLVAAVVPGTTMLIYGVVAVFVAGVCWLGPRMSNRDNEVRSALRRLGKRLLGSLWRRL